MCQNLAVYLHIKLLAILYLLSFSGSGERSSTPNFHWTKRKILRLVAPSLGMVRTIMEPQGQQSQPLPVLHGFSSLDMRKQPNVLRNPSRAVCCS